MDNELRFTEGKNLAAEQTSHTDPPRGSDGHNDRQDAGLHNEDQQNHPQHGRNGADQLTQTHHQVVRHTAEVAGNAAVENAHSAVKNGDHNTDQQADPGTGPAAGEDITSQLVSTEKVLHAGTLVGSEQILLIVLITAHHRLHNCHGNDNQQDDRGDHRQLVLLKPPPCIAPIGQGGAGHLVSISVSCVILSKEVVRQKNLLLSQNGLIHIGLSQLVRLLT